jgi:hypothetical protein
MKKLCIASFVFFLSLLTYLGSYQARESGLLDSLLPGHKPLYLQNKKPLIVYEKRSDGTISNVLYLNGRDAFLQYVLSSSYQKPVVVMVQSAVSLDSKKMKEVFHAVADEYKDAVVFVTIDLLARHDGLNQNYEIISSIMNSQNVNRIELPVMLFFKNAQLYTPQHLPTAILQGFYTKENLIKFVHDKYFPQKQDDHVVDFQSDLTATVTSK